MKADDKWWMGGTGAAIKCALDSTEEARSCTVPCAVHCALCTVHCALCRVPCIMCTALCHVHCAVCIAPCHVSSVRHCAMLALPKKTKMELGSKIVIVLVLRSPEHLEFSPIVWHTSKMTPSIALQFLGLCRASYHVSCVRHLAMCTQSLSLKPDICHRYICEDPSLS